VNEIHVLLRENGVQATADSNSQLIGAYIFILNDPKSLVTAVYGAPSYPR